MGKAGLLLLLWTGYLAMLVATLRTSPYRSSRLVVVFRASHALTTESVAGGYESPLPPLPPQQSSNPSTSSSGASPNSPHTSIKPRSYFYPQPRPVSSSSNTPSRLSTHQRHSLRITRLPPTFGRNQFLPVADSTRALLENIVAKFNSPIRYAFAYGSGVFEQDGYTNTNGGGAKMPMVDFMFAVTHPEHFHYMNMQQYPAHYPLHARLFGSSYVAKVENLGPGVWFNAYVPMGGVVSLFPCSFPLPSCVVLLDPPFPRTLFWIRGWSKSIPGTSPILASSLTALKLTQYNLSRRLSNMV